MEKLLGKVAGVIDVIYPGANVFEIDSDECRIYFTQPESENDYQAVVDVFKEKVVIFEKKFKTENSATWIAVNYFTCTEFNNIVGSEVFEYID